MQKDLHTGEESLIPGTHELFLNDCQHEWRPRYSERDLKRTQMAAASEVSLMLILNHT